MAQQRRAAIATHSGLSVSRPEGAAGAPESALKGGGCRSAAASSLALLLSSSAFAFGGVINRCCAVNMGFISKGFKFCRRQQYSVTRCVTVAVFPRFLLPRVHQDCFPCYPVCNHGRVPQNSVTQSARGLSFVLRGV